MTAVVCNIEGEKVLVVDEIQIYSSNTNEMCEEIKIDIRIKILLFIQTQVQDKENFCWWHNRFSYFEKCRI